MIDSSVMKYNVIRLFFICLTVLVAVSCGDDSYLQQGTTEDAILPIGNVEVHPLGDVFKVAYTSPVSWGVEFRDKENKNNEVDWISITSPGGDVGTTVVQFTVDPYISEDDHNKDRECQVIFCKKGSREVLNEFDISQARAVLTVSEEKMHFGWNKSIGEQAFKVETNIEWDYEVSGENSMVFTVDTTDVVNEDGTKGSVWAKVNAVSPNFGIQDYKAEITVKPVKRDNKGKIVELERKVLEGLKRTIEVSQDYLIFAINHSGLMSFSELGHDYVDTANVDVSGHTAVQTITVTCETEWELSSDAAVDESWGLELTPSEEGKNVVVGGRNVKTKTLTIKVKKPNPSEESRRAAFDLYVSADDVREKRTVEIYQYAYKFDSALWSSDVSFDNSSGENTLSLQTTGPWSILSDDVPEWLSINPMEGVGNADITIKAEKQNLSFEDLRCDVKILSGLNTLTDTYSFSQDRFKFEVEWPEAFDFELPRHNTEEHTIKITSSGPWTLELESYKSSDGSIVDDGTDWVAVESFSGQAGSSYVTIKAKNANPDKNSQRGKVIKISSDLHKYGISWPEKALYSNIFIQDKFRFDIVRDDVDITKQPTNFVAYNEKANTSTFIMQCSAPWRILENCDWVSFNSYEGTGMDDLYPTITMTAKNNVSGKWDEPRDAVITVESDPIGDGSYTDVKTFEVAQDALVFTVAALNEYPVGALNDEDCAFSVLATEGLPWTMTVSDEDTWVGCETTDYKGSKDVTFKPFHNGTLSDRDGNITISSSVIENLNPTTMTVKQSAYEFDNTPVILDGFKALNPESKYFNLVCMGPWKVEACPDWVTVDPSYGSGDSKLTVTLDKNTATGDSRPCTIKIVSQVGGVDHTKEVTVVQDPFTWEITPSDNISTDNVLKVDALGDKGSISLICSGSWTASADSAFVKVSPDKGYGGKDITETVTVTVEPNYTRSEREAKVSVSSDDNSAHKHELTVVQNAYVFEVDTLFTENISYEGGVVIAVKCSERPEVSMPEGVDWLETSYSADRVFNVTAKENTTSSPRSAEVTVYSPNVSKNPALTKTFTITQEAAPVQEPAPAM